MALLTWYRRIHYLIKTWLIMMLLGVLAVWLSPEYTWHDYWDAMLDITLALVIAKLCDNRPFRTLRRRSDAL